MLQDAFLGYVCEPTDEAAYQLFEAASTLVLPPCGRILRNYELAQTAAMESAVHLVMIGVAWNQESNSYAAFRFSNGNINGNHLISGFQAEEYVLATACRKAERMKRSLRLRGKRNCMDLECVDKVRGLQLAEAAAQRKLNEHLAKELWAQVEELPPNLRDTMVLRYVLELSTRELAAALHVDHATVSRWINKAERILREKNGF